jgi:SNF2 family DNA or RNA helicase
VHEGRKSVVFATQPDVLDRLAEALRARGIASVRYHGKIPIAQRTRALNREFRHGPAPVLLVSIGAGQTGLNLPQASRALFLSYDWSAKATFQCLGRLLRPQQTEHVEAVYLELEGSINAYQRQMIEFKTDAAAVGLDDQDSQLDDVEFVHVDTLLGRFVEALQAQNSPLSDIARARHGSDTVRAA